MRSLLIGILFPFILIITACSESEEGNGNADQASELTCQGLTGHWQLARVTCDEEEVSATESIISFSSTNETIQRRGPDSCHSVQSWQFSFSAANNSLSFTPNQYRSCVENGEAVYSCTGSNLNCQFETESSLAASEDFDSCWMSDGNLHLQRTSSGPSNSDLSSHCSDQQEEILVFTSLEELDTDYPIARGILDIVESSPTLFNIINVGNSQIQTLTLLNTGNGPVENLSATLPGSDFQFFGGNYPGNYGNCGDTLLPFESCQVNLTMTPTISGSVATTASFNYEDGVSSQQLDHSLSGAGGSPLGHLEVVDHLYYDFGDLPSSAGRGEVTVTLANNGSQNLNFVTSFGLGAPFGLKGGFFPGTGGTCGGTLAIAATCTLLLECAPSTIGEWQDRFFVTYDNGVNNVDIFVDLSCHSTM